MDLHSGFRGLWDTEIGMNHDMEKRQETDGGLISNFLYYSVISWFATPMDAGEVTKNIEYL